MPATDCPDWQNVVTLSTGGPVTDAPDWQEVIVGPGGTPISGGAAPDWSAANFGLGAWTMAPWAAFGAFTIGSGAVRLAALPVATTVTVSHIWCVLELFPATLHANESFMGIYEITGLSGFSWTWTKVAATAAGACDTPWTNAVGLVPLSASVTLTAGNPYYAALLVNQATGTTMQVAGNIMPTGGTGTPWLYNPAAAAGSTNNTYPMSLLFSSGLTALPSTITSNAQTGANSIFMGVY